MSIKWLNFKFGLIELVLSEKFESDIGQTCPALSPLVTHRVQLDFLWTSQVASGWSDPPWWSVDVDSSCWSVDVDSSCWSFDFDPSCSSFLDVDPSFWSDGWSEDSEAANDAADEDVDCRLVSSSAKKSVQKCLCLKYL